MNEEKNMVYIYHGILFILERNRILTRAITQYIMLSKMSQTQKVKYCMIPLAWGTQSSQIHKDREWKVVYRG